MYLIQWFITLLNMIGQNSPRRIWLVAWSTAGKPRDQNWWPWMRSSTPEYRESRGWFQPTWRRRSQPSLTRNATRTVPSGCWGRGTRRPGTCWPSGSRCGSPHPNYNPWLLLLLTMINLLSNRLSDWQKWLWTGDVAVANYNVSRWTLRPECH